MRRRSPLALIALLMLVPAVVLTATSSDWLWATAPVGAFQAAGDWLVAPMRMASFLGQEQFYLLLVPLIFWCVDKRLGASLGVLLVASGLLNGGLKSLLKHARPYWQNPALHLADEASFSLPSGHAQNSSTLFGYLAWWIAGGNGTGRRRPGWVPVFALIVLLVGLSRVYLGVHFPGDILWGCAAGLALLAVYVALDRPARAWLGGLSLPAHLLMATVTAAAILGLNLWLAALPFQADATLNSLYTLGLATSLEEAATMAGMAWGLWVGLACEVRYVHFAVTGSITRRVLRYGLGLVGLFAIWMGLKVIFPIEPPGVALAFRIVRYALAMLWAILAWPWLFTRVGLGGHEPGDVAQTRPAPRLVTGTPRQ